MPSLDLGSIRRQIPSLDGSVYMNTGGTGPLPTPVVQEITASYKTVADGGPDMPDVRGPIEERFEAARDAATGKSALAVSAGKASGRKREGDRAWGLEAALRRWYGLPSTKKDPHCPQGSSSGQRSLQKGHRNDHHS